MNPLDALMIGVGCGLFLGLAKRYLGTTSGMRTGARVVVKWRGGIGRASVIEARGGMLVVSSPLMRESHPRPLEGGELLLKPIGGGKTRRGSYLSESDSAWMLQLK
jgi:hypothetical protein